MHAPLIIIQQLNKEIVNLIYMMQIVALIVLIQFII